MAQNIYDQPGFFANCSRLTWSVHGLDGVPEWPAFRSLLPNLEGSLKLVARLADVFGLDRRNLLILAHPEAKRAYRRAKPEERRRKESPSWRRFIENQELLARYNVTDRELRALEGLSLLGTVRSAKEFLTILTLIRDIPPSK